MTKTKLEQFKKEFEALMLKYQLNLAGGYGGEIEVFQYDDSPFKINSVDFSCVTIEADNE